MRNHGIEILAPAGSMESLTAAVRAGADAVYLGGPTLNARRGAQNFTRAQLTEAVSYSHARNTRVYLTVNTIVFDEELAEAGEAIRTACDCGVDALIVQDLAVARLARDCAPSLELHASTQMSVHNPEGARALERLGFARAVIARELTAAEIAEISAQSGIQIESFVHGALCMCVSGGCYLSSMIGGRSGNRGLCAQPCRLPFRSGGSEYALSLRDLSLIERVGELVDAGVVSLKIEGRLKRPEYVAAAVSACVAARAGESPDLETLASVFSRSGFTDGYFTGNRGDGMFGVRRKEDVTAAAPILKRLTRLYHEETPRIPVTFSLKIEQGQPAELAVTDGAREYRFRGDAAQPAQTAPTTPERAEAALRKTGGTPFFVEEVHCAVDPGLMLPISALNDLRRRALGEVLARRGEIVPRPFRPPAWKKPERLIEASPALRVQLSSAAQYDPALADLADQLILPFGELDRLPALPPERVILELPRIRFSGRGELEAVLRKAKSLGYGDIHAGNLGGVELGARFGFRVHGGMELNAANTLALEEFAALGCVDMTMSFECSLARLRGLGGGLPRGVCGYGYLPLMVTRNRPAGMKSDRGELTDRLGNRFRVERSGQAYVLYNCVPLWLADRRGEFAALDFMTLSFTRESAAECLAVTRAYREGAAPQGEITRGLYYRAVQ